MEIRKNIKNHFFLFYLLTVAICFVCLLLSGCSKEEVLEKYNAVVEKVGEVQLTNDINLQGKRDYGEDYYTGTYQAEYKKFSDTE